MKYEQKETILNEQNEMMLILFVMKYWMKILNLQLFRVLSNILCSTILIFYVLGVEHKILDNTTAMHIYWTKKGGLIRFIYSKSTCIHHRARFADEDDTFKVPSIFKIPRFGTVLNINFLSLAVQSLAKLGNKRPLQ